MKLSISNIAWDNKYDEQMYHYLKDNHISGIEIAPTRIFQERPYEHLEAAQKFSQNLQDNYNLTVSSIQSIWYGRAERLFGSEEERLSLLNYSKKAVCFAQALGCKNLVFGCPKNRRLLEASDYDTALSFFYELGEYAAKKNTVLSMEANPTIYNTNFINTTEEAIKIIKHVSSPGFKLNLDLGTMIYNQEKLEVLFDHLDFINHIHISEPHLDLIQKRSIHGNLKNLLTGRYEHYISAEIGKQKELANIYNVITYMKEVFYDI